MVARFISGVRGYDPAKYEAKDVARLTVLEEKGREIGLPSMSWDLAVDVVLFLMVVVLWLTLVGPGQSRRP